MSKMLLPLACIIMGLSSCGIMKQPATEQIETLSLDTFTVRAVPDPPPYKGAEKRINDVLHTKLDLRFNWDSAFVHGKATLDVQAYHQAVDELTLDAQGFVIHEVKLGSASKLQVVKYHYDGHQLTIPLDRAYKKSEPYQVYIAYTAKPNQLKTEGGNAIASDKGLYFIKKKGEDKEKWQLWTQGEPEANSAWFPTIDAPNERMTQEIYLTVDTMYETLSNGVLVFQTNNDDGTRTDYWKMDKGHAPYLVMIAVGNFSIYRDSWRDINVNYYVDPEYAAYASSIFGLTPKMLEFYSIRLGVDFPWPSYSQIVVKDFVSGAMENTTAVTHGEFLHQTNRERLDGDYEDFIAHELFHHWFGDLVTCESWANLPLNESFATYGEYLWIEHQHGQDEADYHLYQDLRAYLQQASVLPRKMIRFDYDKADDMFDAHSYQKGGRIIHLLRNYLGDELFFEGITLYLNRFAYQSVEIHQLRQVFEEISGEDLTWFFDQWFFHKGHPVLSISSQYLSDTAMVKVVITQTQNFNRTPLFRLPITIDVYAGGDKIRYQKTLKEAEEVYYFPVEEEPDLVNVDAEKVLIAEKEEEKSSTAWRFMYQHATLFLDRYEAIQQLSKRKDSLAKLTLLEALSDPFWKIREMAVTGSHLFAEQEDGRLKDALMDRLQNDEKSAVRSTAILTLSEYYDDPNLIGLYEGALSDSSYEVMSAALMALVAKDESKGMEVVKKLEGETNSNVITGIVNLYAKKGGAKENAYFVAVKPLLSSFERYTYLNAYHDYLKRQNDSICTLGIAILGEIAEEDQMWWVRLTAVGALKDLEEKYEQREEAATKKIEAMKEEDAEYETYQKMKASAQSILKTIQEKWVSLKASETDEKVRKALSR
jgi:aminopeptidase N